MGGRTRTALLVVAAFFVFAVPAAHARDFNCDASAVRLQLGGQQTVEPLTANRGSATCKEVKSQTKQTVGPATLGALIAETAVPNSTQADAQGGVGFVSISAAALAGIPVPTLDAIDQIKAVPLPPNALLPSGLTIDIRPAVKSIVTGLQTGPLLELAASVANAHARCNGRTATLSGETRTVGLKVLGQEIPTDAAVNQVLTLFNGQTIDPSKLDLSQIVLPPGLSFTDPGLGTVLQQVVRDALAAQQPITLPESLLNLSLKPSSQVRTDGGLTQQGLSVSLGIAGNPVLSLLAGEARVSVDSVNCLAPAQAIQQQALSCSSRRLALIDVLDRGKYVTLLGAADKRLAGKRIAIRSKADGGRVVARPRVSKAGLFRARAALPPERWRDTNRARYIATYRNAKSLNLKLHRRMYFTAVRSKHGRVVLSGVVTQPRLSDAE